MSGRVDYFLPQLRRWKQLAGDYGMLVSQHDKFITNKPASWDVAAGDLFSSHHLHRTRCSVAVL
jgi:hypothetical protein